MNWNNTYLLNETTIDSHHKKLIEIMSSLEGKQTVSKSEYTRTLKALYDYTIYHFNYEEGKMDASAYPQAEVHKKMHKAFLEKINTWTDESKKLPDIISNNEAKQVFQFGIAWLNRHILTTDKKFVEFLNNKK